MSDESPGAIIRRARQESGMKQRELASRLGVHFTTVGYWERNKFFPEQHWAALNKLLHINLRPPGAPAPGQPEPSAIPAKTLAAIREHFDPKDQPFMIEALERRMRGEPPPSEPDESESEPSSGREVS